MTLRCHCTTTLISIRCLPTSVYIYIHREDDNLLPEESPAILIGFRHLCVRGRSARVGLACSIRSTVRGIVLVVGGEHGEGLCPFCFL